jgi:lipopolysaccharide/colanic/teichoic acid biosynthesis glycosyltransferase
MDAGASLVWRQPARVDAGVSAARPSPSVGLSTPWKEPGAAIWDGRSALDSRFAAFISSQLPAEISSSQPSSGRLIVSVTRLNDIRRLSKFLRACAGRMDKGGYFAARYTPLENVEQDLRRRFAGARQYAAVALHFAWRRVCPKIPYVNALYFAITNGRNRVVSRTEMWGRMQACGLTVIGETDGEGELYLVAQKTSDPVVSRTPSYYPVIALERVALGGQIIRAHKVRTMYPFSEFIQKRVFEANALGATGKFADDFRITGYGRVLRKYWIDEIPQLLDWWRGDIKLVGLRAMSRHYFSLYPGDFQDLYIRVKPGLVPPLFGESTVGFQHIVDVELRYLEAYLRRPAWTDVRYLFATVYDIVFKGLRSR